MPLPDLDIAFPPDGVRVRLASNEDGAEPLPLRAEGGVLPLTWLVNGSPVPVYGRLSLAEWLARRRRLCRYHGSSTATASRPPRVSSSSCVRTGTALQDTDS